MSLKEEFVKQFLEELNHVGHHTINEELWRIKKFLDQENILVINDSGLVKEPLDVEKVFEILQKVHGCKPKMEDCTFQKCNNFSECTLLAEAICREFGKENGVNK